MRTVIQRVKKASVSIGDNIYSEIGKGLVVLVGVEKGDTEKDADYLVDKILNLRIFDDEAEKMNFSVSDVRGEILIISQFTLLGSCARGRRPSYDKAALEEEARKLYNYFIDKVKESGVKTAEGKFKEKMLVEIFNDGPVTILLDKKVKRGQRPFNIPL